MKWDVIALVESAYDLESNDREWLSRLLERAAPRLDRGFGVSVSTYSPGLSPERSLVETQGMSGKVRQAMIGLVQAYPEEFQKGNTPHGLGRCVTFTQQLGMRPEAGRTFGPIVLHMHPVGVKDFLGVMALDPSGHAIWLGAPISDTGLPGRQECATWSRVTAHISAGARLRRALAGLSFSDASVGCEAVLSACGEIEHAGPFAKPRAARDLLRRAALAMDRARSKVRSNEDEALNLWRGLIAGRWSLVERFDHDGRRYLLAHRNEPQTKDPRALTLRERQVLAYMAAGDSLKTTSYTLGLSITSIFRYRTTAMRKLGLTCTADVVRLFTTTAAADRQPCVDAAKPRPRAFHSS
jgi:DNA-binding CsgD family transcriptional regulator